MSSLNRSTPEVHDGNSWCSAQIQSLLNLLDTWCGVLQQVTLSWFSFSHKPNCSFCRAFLPRRNLSLQENLPRMTTRYSAELNLLMQWTAEERPQWPGVMDSCQQLWKWGKRPTEALGLIYLTCQGQDPPKWANKLTPPPRACLVFSPLWISPQSGSVDMKQEAQNRNSSPPFWLTFRLLD